MQILQRGECQAADFGGFNGHVDYKSCLYSRSVLKKYKSARVAIDEQKKIKQEVVLHYQRDIEKRELHLKSIENHIKSNMHIFARKKKSGSLSIDQFPDIGTLSLGLPRETLKPDPDYWSKEFPKTVIKFDSEAFKARYDLVSGKITDKSTGEIVDLPNVNISKNSSLIFRSKGDD